MFQPVSWFPPLDLTWSLLIEGASLDVTFAPDGLLALAHLRWNSSQGRFHALFNSRFEAMSEAELNGLLDAVCPDDRSGSARALRWQARSALVAKSATDAARVFPEVSSFLSAARSQSEAFLNAIDDGKPMPSAWLLLVQQALPNGFLPFGSGLPTAEVIDLFVRLGKPVFELGAGIGLVARALAQAGVSVEASDPDISGRSGLAFPVACGVDDRLGLGLRGVRDEVTLVLWPSFDDPPWIHRVFEAAAPGQYVAMASPEFEMVIAPEGVRYVIEHPLVEHSNVQAWRAALLLLARLERDFELVATAPMVATGWPTCTTPLRLWRRRS